jgi:predicted O-linked N-acetylglucosamine transferase (SPINDLY family)
MPLAAAPARADPGSALADCERLIAAGEASKALARLGPWLAGPHRPDALRLAAIAALEARDPRAALVHALDLTEARPRSALAWMLVGRAHKALGALDPAARAYRMALELDPGLAAAHVSLGIVLRHLGDLDGAAAAHRRALEIEPRMPAALANLGIVLAARLSRGVDSPLPESALQALQDAVAAAPRDVAARQNLGLAYGRLNRLDEAAQQLNAALALDPARVDSCLMLEAVLTRAHWHHGARELCERWLALNPLHPEVASRLCNTLRLLGDFDAARAWGERALVLAPDMPELRHVLAQVLEQQLDVPGALRHLDQACTRSPGYLPAWQVRAMLVNYVEESPQAVWRAQQEAARQVVSPRLRAPGAPALRRSTGQPSGRPLRIGLVSGDLRRHSVAFFIEPLLRGCDRRRLSFSAYSTGEQPDAVSERLRTLCDHWAAVGTVDDDTLAQRVAEDGIDVLVDLAGHTAGGRLGLFARRPAPLQLSYLGYPTDTGLPEIDGRISDTVIDPPGNRTAAPGPVLRLERSMFCFRPDDADAAPETDAEAVGRLPALQSGEVTFGSFNNVAKVTPQTLRLWAAVLQAVPRSQLLLKHRASASTSLCDRVRAALAEQGVAPARVQFSAWRDGLEEHLAMYRQVDIALDTFPYNGATTTCEALWMGVPVVSLCGATHASRVGASLLRAAGLPACAAGRKSGYVQQAVALAGDLPALAALRAGLRRRLRASPLRDERGFADAFADLLERAARSPAGAAAG